MKITQKDIDQILAEVRRHFLSYEKNLEIFFITHANGGRETAFRKFYQHHKDSIYGQQLEKLLLKWNKKPSEIEHSEFIGLSTLPMRGWGGLFERHQYLAVVALNLDLYQQKDEFEYDIYRLCARICDSLMPQKKTKNHETIEQKGLQRLRYNLKADLFSMFALSAAHKKNFIIPYANHLAGLILRPQKGVVPEMRPCLVAIDQTRRLLAEMQKSGRRGNVIEESWKAAETIDQIISSEKLKLWHRFAKASQDMAWRDFPPEIILSAAIDGNDNIEIRKLGILISRLTETKPSNFADSRGFYNPYMNSAENEEMHYNQIKELMDNVLTRCVFVNNALPFFEAADKQVRMIKEGRFMGWCGHALHEAGLVFNESIKTGSPAIPLTRKKFEEETAKVGWNIVKQLGDEILYLRRIGHKVEYSNLIETLAQKTEYSPILNTVRHYGRNEKKAAAEHENASSFLGGKDKAVDAEDFVSPFMNKDRDNTKHA
jgi:hypothetical protein